MYGSHIILVPATYQIAVTVPVTNVRRMTACRYVTTYQIAVTVPVTPNDRMPIRYCLEAERL